MSQRIGRKATEATETQHATYSTEQDHMSTVRQHGLEQNVLQPMKVVGPMKIL